MNYKSYLFCFLLVLFFGCSWDKRILEKRILIEGNIWVELSHISDITFDQEWVEFVNLESGHRQLIYKGGEICTLEFYKNELKIFIEGGSYVKFQPKNNYNVEVVLDTTCRGASLYKNR